MVVEVLALCDYIYYEQINSWISVMLCVSYVTITVVPSYSKPPFFVNMVLFCHANRALWPLNFPLYIQVGEEEEEEGEEGCKE